ncbi:MAG: efflux RND transporter periplasmic adaptor subunit [Bacteroidota bacterium]
MSTGALLVQIDAREAVIDYEEAQAELLKAQTDYAIRLSDSREGAVDTTKVAAARVHWDTVRRGVEAGTYTAAEADEARRAFESAVIRSGGRRSEVQAVTIGLAQAEQRVARAALELDRTAVRAPFAGRIADVEVEQGQRIGIGETLFRLLDDHRMRVEVDVLEADLVRIKRGAKASVRIPALDDRIIEGEVYAINPQVDVEAGTGRVTVVVPNPGRTLVAGLFCYVSLEVGQLEDRIVVPKEAILVRQGRDLVFKVEDGRAQWVYVTAGVRAGDWVEVTEGVAPGDSIAVDGHFALAHDAPVRVSAVLEGYGMEGE